MHPRALLQRFGLRPKKRLGQHFLIDHAAAARIAALVAPSEHLYRTIEIGPGTGELTRALIAQGCEVTALEIDPDMVRVLRARDDLQQAQILAADALTFDYEQFGGSVPWCVTGNLPYNLATVLILRLIEMRSGPERFVVMVQKEVAERFRAHPGTAAYGSLSVAVQYAMQVERLFSLKPAAFYPRPKIDSTVVLLERRKTKAVHVRDERWFLQVVRAAFAYRRKTLANSLSLAIGVRRTAVTQVLQNIGLDTEIRGEQLAIADFARIADSLPP